MNITVEIKSCTDCKHLSHTGGFTPGGAQPCCDHDDNCKGKKSNCFNRVIPYTVDQSMGMRFNKPKAIPSWCPLKRGSKY